MWTSRAGSADADDHWGRRSSPTTHHLPTAHQPTAHQPTSSRVPPTNSTATTRLTTNSPAGRTRAGIGRHGRRHRRRVGEAIPTPSATARAHMHPMRFAFSMRASLRSPTPALYGSRLNPTDGSTIAI